MTSSAPSRDESTAVLRWLALGLVALPFWQWAGSDFDRSGTLVLLGPALWAGRSTLAASFRELWIARRAICQLLLGILAVALFSAIRSSHTAASVVMIARWIVLGAAAILAGRLRARADAVTWLAGALVLGAAAGVIVVWGLWFRPDRTVFPLYFDPRHVGYHTLMAAVAASFLVTRPEANRRTKLGWYAAGVIVWGGLFWTGGRAPLLALAGSLVLVLWQRPHEERRPLVISSAILGLAGLVLAQLLAPAEAGLGWWHAVQRTAQATNAYELTSSRSIFWTASWRHYLEAPLLGFGPDAYQFLLPKLDGQQPHNFVLQFLLDLGAVGGVLALAVLGFSLLAAWRMMGARSGAEPVSTNAWVWPAMLFAGTAMGLLDGTFYHLIGLLPLALAWGHCVQPVEPPAARPLPAPITAAARAGTALVLVSSVLLLVHGWLFYLATVAPPPPGPTSAVARTWRFFPSSTLGVARWFATWADDDRVTALEWMTWTAERSPNSALFRVQAARLLMEQGRRREAEPYLRQALAEAHYSRRPYVQSLLDQFYPPSPPAVQPR